MGYGNSDEKPSSANQTAAERDQRMDAKYHGVCTCGNCPKDVLAQVVTHLHPEEYQSADGTVTRDPGLVERYMAAVKRVGRRADDDASIVDWEIATFGDAMFASAHLVLKFAVFDALGKHDYSHRKASRGSAPRLKQGLTDEQRRDRMLSALDKVAEGKAMPPSHQSKRDEDESRSKLREQAEEINA
jgi:hypothetical protein